MTRGSVIVAFTIRTAAAARARGAAAGEEAGGEGPTPLELAQRLEEQLADDSSPLRQGIVTCSVVGVRSRPASASSSAAVSARGGGGSLYDAHAAVRAAAKAAEAANRPIGLREQLRRAREERKRRDRENPDEFDIQVLRAFKSILGAMYESDKFLREAQSRRLSRLRVI